MALLSSSSSVIPAKAGIHISTSRRSTMDSGFRRNDDKKRSQVFSYVIALNLKRQGESQRTRPVILPLEDGGRRGWGGTDIAAGGH
jgi:hypothetical protein